MKRAINFSPGPAALPEAVLRQAADEMLDWHGSGMSVMEMSHRGPQFMSIYEDALATFRRLAAVPANYRVLFLQGGAIGENAILPMNLIGRTGRADYVDSGNWSQRSLAEARKYGDVNIVASGDGFSIPARGTWRLDPRAAYVHICSNETLTGVEYTDEPDTGGVPLVADMSSNILSRPVDVSRYGAIYAGAQKNMGPSGVTVVVVREDLLGHALPITPSAFDWTLQGANDSMFNTPPTWAIYILGLVCRHIEGEGGLAAMASRNRTKADRLYAALDASGFYTTRVARDDRSRMNVTFRTPSEALDAAFVNAAEAAGMVQLKGHRITGGLRASLYNAVPLAHVEALVAFMRDFERANG